MNHPAYDELTATWQRLHHFGHLQAIASWDRMALMPASGNAEIIGDRQRVSKAIHHSFHQHIEMNAGK